MKWLVTGGCGFIGRSLVQHLRRQEDDHRVRVLDNLSIGTRDDLSSVSDYLECSARQLTFGPSVELFVGDILEEGLVRQAARGADVIVHLAANTGVASSVENPRRDCVTNVIGTLNCLEAARIERVPRFVFASSGAPIGECAPPIHEKLAPHPVSPYGASKLAGEGYCSAYYGTYGLETVALRFGNVYGPNSRHKSSVVAKFILNAINGESLEVYGDGAQTRDFIYVEDLLDAVLKAATVRGIGGETFQVATSRETTVNELVEQLMSVFQEDGIERPRVVHGEPRVGDVKRNFSDTSKARDRLGWRSRTQLADGLRRTVLDFLDSS